MSDKVTQYKSTLGMVSIWSEEFQVRIYGETFKICRHNLREMHSKRKGRFEIAKFNRRIN